MKTFFFATLFVSFSSYAVLTEMITDQNGKKLMLSQAGAAAYCSSNGMRLPAPKAFAQQMVALGKGQIEPTKYPDMSVDTSYVRLEMKWWKNAGYQAFSIYKNETEVMEFYYKHNNWPPVVNFDWVWTSSIVMTSQPYYPEYAVLFNLNSRNGFEPDTKGGYHYFRCEIL
jgi:hypothetical protein